MLALAALNRRRRMQRRRNRRCRFWCLPRPRQSWFEIHYNDHRIPDDFFKQQLRVRRATFNQLLNLVSPHVARQDTSMRSCIPAEKILAIGLYRLAHANSYVSIAPVFNVGKSTVIEAVQDVVNVLYDLRNLARFPGSAHDARVLRNSNIYQEAEQGNILQAPRIDIDGNDIGPYLVGDKANDDWDDDDDVGPPNNDGNNN
ncbi:hypothetical protein pdam_00013830, partial [Pocillopora damicornis]